SHGVSDCGYFRPGAAPVTVRRRAALEAQRSPRRGEDVGERDRFTPGGVEVRAGGAPGGAAEKPSEERVSLSSVIVGLDSTGVSFGIAYSYSPGRCFAAPAALPVTRRDGRPAPASCCRWMAPRRSTTPSCATGHVPQPDDSFQAH